MSAFVVSKSHIDAMVQAGLAPTRVQGSKLTWWAEPEFNGEWSSLDHTNADQVGSMLWGENVASVDHRYSPPGREAIYGEAFSSPDDGFNLPGTYTTETIAAGVEPLSVPEWLMSYRFPLGRVRSLSPVAVLKAIDCYEYQSCEHDGWETSEAKRFCDALRSRMIGCLPGYSEAAWEVKS